jgi:hypothetical protein
MEKACLFCNLFFIVPWGALQPSTAWRAKLLKSLYPSVHTEDRFQAIIIMVQEQFERVLINKIVTFLTSIKAKFIFYGILLQCQTGKHKL